MFQLRLLSFFQRICLSFYSGMALVLFCTMVRVRGRVGTTVLFLSRKVAELCRSECVAVVEVARLNSENVASEKKRNSLKLSGDRLHAVTCKKNPYLDMGGFNAHTQIV